MPLYYGSEQVGRLYIGAEEVGVLYRGHEIAFAHDAAPTISSVMLNVRNASQAVIPPSATGTEAGKTVQSYRDTVFANAHDLQLIAAYKDTTSIVCNRYEEDVSTPTTQNPVNTNVAGTRSEFYYTAQFQPEERSRFVITATNAEGIGVNHEIDFQWWSTPTVQVSTRSTPTTSGSPPIAYTELFLDITITGEPAPTLSLSAPGETHPLNIQRAWDSARRQGFDTFSLHLSHPVGTNRTTTYTVNASSNVPGGTALTASASATFTWP